MIPNTQPADMRDPGVKALLRRLADLEERCRRLEAVERTYGSRGTVTAYTAASSTATITDDAGNARDLPFTPPYPTYSPAVNDRVTIIDLPGYVQALRTNT